MSENGMEKLLSLLKDGNARTIGMLATELNTSESDVLREIEFLEHMGLIKRILNNPGKCSTSCSGCSGDGQKNCKGCLPDGGFKNMGEMWEVV